MKVTICVCGHNKAVHCFDNNECVCVILNCKCNHYIHEYRFSYRGVPYATTNINQFVKDNSELFDDKDLIPKKCPEHIAIKKRQSETWCNAERNLRSVADMSYSGGNWKGWSAL